MSPYNVQPIPRDQIDLRQEIEIQPEVTTRSKTPEAQMHSKRYMQ